MPTRGLIDPQVIAGVAALARAWDTQPTYESGHLSAGMTRNLIVRRFLDSECDYLVMVDDDVAVNQGEDLIESMVRNGLDVVGASYPIFNQDLYPLPFPPAYRLVDGAYELVQHEPGVVECDAIGTGCVAIRRRVVEALRIPFAETMSADGSSIVSDDSVFCKRARDAGFRIGMNFDIRCDHFSRVSLGSILNGVSQALAYA